MKKVKQHIKAIAGAPMIEAFEKVMRASNSVSVSKRNEKITEISLFGEITNEYVCEGCKNGNHKMHNGIYCKIMNWDTNRKIKFETMLKKK